MKTRLLIASLALLISASTFAATANRQQYIVKTRALFLQPNASAAPSLRDVITRAGGQVDLEWQDRLVITLPDAAVQAVAAHVATKYMQLVRSGRPSSLPAPSPVRTGMNLLAKPTSVRSTGPLRPIADSVSTWDSGTYAYDGAGNITGIGNDSFVYDLLSRITNASVKGNTETYTYDAGGLGNLIQKTTTSAGTTLTVDLATSSTTNRLTAQSYDTAGNLTGDSNETNAFDPFNMVREKDVSSYGSELYLYDANDERIAVISNPCGAGSTLPTCTNALLTISGRDEAGKVLRQFDLPYQSFASTTPWLWLEDYVYRDGLLLAAERPAAEGGRRHFHLDHLGTPRLVTGAGGISLAALDYYPFGVEITPLRQETAAGFDREEPMKFTGHERDFNIGTATENTNYNDYMHARSTVAQWGRFASVDPAMDLKKIMPNPQLWNRYSYVINNPLRYSDPDGCEHVNEPGFTKPLSEANDWAEHPEVSWAFYTEGGLLAAGAVEAGGSWLLRAASTAVMASPGAVLFGMRVLAAFSGDPGNMISLPEGQTAAQGKAEFLLGQVVDNPKSLERGATFAQKLGFNKETLTAALKSHLLDRANNATVDMSRSTPRVSVTGTMTGANGVKQTVTSIWQYVNKQFRLVTAW